MLVQYSIALFGALIPAIAFAWIALSYGRSSRELRPWWLLGVVFLWGAVPTIAIARNANRFFNSVMMYQPEVGLTTPEQQSAALIILGILTPMLEEAVKGLPVLLIFLAYRKGLRGIEDGILYGAIVGLGYGAAENFQYILRAGLSAEIGIVLAVIVTRSIIFGLTHAIWCMSFGIGLGIASASRSTIKSLLAPFVGLVVGILMHGLHNSSFLWVTLKRDYGIVAVAASLTIYIACSITWLVFAVKARKRESQHARSVPSPMYPPDETSHGDDDTER